MNMLSWLIYSIGLVSGVERALGWFIGFTAVISFISMICFIISVFIDADSKQDVDKVFIKGSLAFKKYFFRSFFGLCTFILLYAFIPSERTMVLIAASEVGQRVVQSEQMGEALKKAGDVSGIVGDVTNDSVQLLKTYIQKETLSIKKEISDSQNTQPNSDNK